MFQILDANQDVSADRRPQVVGEERKLLSVRNTDEEFLFVTENGDVKSVQNNINASLSEGASYYLDRDTPTYLSIADTPHLSFNRSSSDCPFTFIVGYNQATLYNLSNDSKEQFKKILISKYNTGAFEWSVFTNKLSLFNYDNAANNISISINENFEYEKDYIVAYTYNGDRSATGLKAYVNGNNCLVNRITSGTYTGQINTITPVRFGTTVSSTTDSFKGKIFFSRVFNRELTKEEVQKYTFGMLDYADISATNTNITSGTLVKGKRYRIENYVAGDDFLHVGASSNTTGVEFIAIETTPDVWTNSSALRRIGCVAEYLPAKIDETIWYEKQNDLNATSTGATAINMVTSMANPTFNNLTVNGDLTVNGTTTTIDTVNLVVEDNLILINKNQTGTPNVNLISGIEIERGDLTNYQFIFRESDDTFVIGEIGSLQAVATRQDTPTANAVLYWNDTLKRLDSSSVTASGSTLTGSLSGTASNATKSTNLAGGNNTTLLGSIPYQSNVDITTLLPPNVTTTNKFLQMTGTGTNGAAPFWGTIDTLAHNNLTTIQAAGTGVTYGHINDTTQTIAGSKTFSNDTSITTSLGIGTTTADAKLEVLATTTQFRLTYTDASVYTDISTDASGYLNIAPTGGVFTVSGKITASGVGGFASSTYIVNARNPIWRFGNADGFGLSYFQGTAGYDGSSDSVGIHFGTATGVGSEFIFDRGSGGRFIAPLFKSRYSASVYTDISTDASGYLNITPTGGVVNIPGTSTELRCLQIGVGRSGNGISYIDLIGDATYTDYGLRVGRNSGSTADSYLNHRGTGGLYLNAVDAGEVRFNTSNTTRVYIAAASAAMGIGTSTYTEAFNVIGNISFGTTAGKCQMQYNATENSIDFIIN